MKKCPTCSDVDLAISHRHSVEIDYCPKCRGVWLDRGELDKVIQRAAVYDEPTVARDDAVDDADVRIAAGGGGPRPSAYHYPKRKSFWNEMFD